MLDLYSFFFGTKIVEFHPIEVYTKKGERDDKVRKREREED